MISGTQNLLAALCLMMVLALARSAAFPGGSEEVGERGGKGGLEEMKDAEEEAAEEEALPLQAVPDPFLVSLDPRVAYYLSEFLPEDIEVNAETPFFAAPLKRGRYNRLDILKRSRLNQLIHRLLAMRGDRYSYHRASPVRFAAGRR